MTDTPETPGDDPQDETGGVGSQRVEPVGLEVEMQRSYLDYAMSVIVGRALPDVRDGLKPVHRKILYAMYDSGFRPDRGYVKCARVVGDVMGNYHPHGDSSIYDALVRMAPALVAALPADRRQRQLRLAGQRSAGRHAVLRHRRHPGPDRLRARSGSATSCPAPSRTPRHDIDLKVYDRNGDLVRASKFFHSGEHPTLQLRTREGFELTGTHNHPVLCLVSVAGVPTLLWKLLEEIRPRRPRRHAARRAGRVRLLRRSSAVEAAVLAGAFVSEGWVSREPGRLQQRRRRATSPACWRPTTSRSAARAT